MPQYLVAIQHPITFDASQESLDTIREIHLLNTEMEAAGVRFFAGGLESPMGLEVQGTLTRDELNAQAQSMLNEVGLSDRTSYHRRNSPADRDNGSPSHAL